MRALLVSSAVLVTFVTSVALFAGCAGEAVVDPTPAPDPAPSPRVDVAFTDADGFLPLSPPKPGEWLAHHEEPGQTFEQYVDADPVRADGARTVLAFLPAGPFTDEQRAVADAAIEFAGIWFGIETRALPTAELTKVEDWYRERTTPAGDPSRQLRCDWFLRRLLPRHVPDDAVVLIGMTMTDLYPGPGWNYVFGQADLRRRVGVYSLVRYFPEFWGETNDDAAGRRALRRSLQVVVHESGHAFTLAHCTAWQCNMGGSNSLAESDASPLHLCPVCLRKLQWNRGFDVRARYRKLLAFYREHGLQDEASWVAARLATIGEAAPADPPARQR